MAGTTRHLRRTGALVPAAPERDEPPADLALRLESRSTMLERAATESDAVGSAIEHRTATAAGSEPASAAGGEQPIRSRRLAGTRARGAAAKTRAEHPAPARKRAQPGCGARTDATHQPQRRNA